MNDKEQLVLQSIRENPYLSQQDMAEKLNMSRPALANIISGLIKKGEIIGRAYVLPEKQAILTIGGANVDRKLHITNKVQLATSNPVTASESVGGVARNIAENLGRLGNQVKLLTTLGQDADAQMIEQASRAFIELDVIEKLEAEQTGSYTAVLDKDGELVIALANMAIYDALTPKLLEKHTATLVNAAAIVIDLNCPKETVVYVQQVAKERNIPLVIVPVSSPKMNRMPDDLQGVSYFICNRDEAETYLNMTLDGEASYKEAVKALLQKGAAHVVLTLGEQGVIVGDNEGLQNYAAYAIEDVKDVTGAGDAFVSATLHGVMQGDTLHEAVQFALYHAAKTLQANTTVRPVTQNEYNNWRNL
ncbi:PfkB family carbohydrate kinase [Metasolibacillus sp.]|uniref:PfkB family carbohydrate kinase n=1 Tax=Metasolibacillus sp. TaxID=2703680 RepID=UPI0025D16D07|nr:PfkB family carbohydrate kinase [Metasolibacillus sp.]MCT6923857.1 PfkB family carbohydrate kinase [Metasolibacillus sp.]MCT6942378.1 PfkB family carbohydrate kinase [Metasolibacillus sp.]